MTTDWSVVRFETLDSTSEEAKRRAALGDDEMPYWIVAEVQTAGRGRLGRAWQSPTGNLYTTALMAWPHSLEMALRLPFAAALAVSDAIEAVCAGATTQLKWPNDVRVEGQKLAGILIESGEGPTGRWVSV
ncbi:MAG: biotin--[acetyl-CoA-carboxylase] ligase, partial [Pseudomonadota bacterium]